MRWLHFTDLHIGASGTQQTLAINSLLEEVERLVRGSAGIDFVLVSGDLAHSGSMQDYERFETSFISPLRNIPRLGDVPILAVPGNHDVDSRISYPIPYKALREQLRLTWMEESEKGREVRTPRASVFANYEKYVQSAGIISPLPSKNTSILVGPDDIGCDVNIILTNTSWFSGYGLEEDEEGSIPSPLVSIRHYQQQLQGETPTFVVGHHPIDWLIQKERRPLLAFLSGISAVYLHGHTHTVEVKFGDDGLATLGFGAVYQDTLDNYDNTEYFNSFAICELDGGLHIAKRMWDSTAGRWQPYSRNLPHEFRRESAVLTGGHVLRIAGDETTGTGKSDRRNNVKSMPPAVGVVRSLSGLTTDGWSNLLRKARITYDGDVPDVKSKFCQILSSDDPSVMAFEYEDKVGHLHYIECHDGSSLQLTQRRVEAFNTILDRSEYFSASMVTFGAMDPDANSLYVQLKKKRMLVIINEDWASKSESLLSSAQRLYLGGLASSEVSAEIAADSDGDCLLVIKDKLGREWFTIIDENGSSPTEASRSVNIIRDINESLYGMNYRPLGADEADYGAGEVFNRQEYLDACREIYNSVKYAGLSTFGFRIPDGLTLDRIYVDPRAELSPESDDDEAVLRAIDDKLASLPIGDSLRSFMEQQIKRRYSGVTSYEVGAARQFYQNHEVILVTGDPGSGKTCFVKKEILEYCRAPRDSWYGRHVPIYVPLSEVAGEIDAGATFFAAISRATAKRGVSISDRHLESLAMAGEAAFFLDGLDEIVSVDQRTKLMVEIKGLLDASLHAGSRFVLTSRPAAVKVVAVPRQFRAMRLQGLTDADIRSLARNVLSIRARSICDEGAVEQRLEFEGESADNDLVEQIIGDCQRSPGIRRIARNPLLLTLLITVYLNRGKPSAKRHRVYEEAVQTLVEVRTKEAGQPRHSDQDLRSHLGRLALHVFVENNGVLPDRREVEDVLLASMRVNIPAAVKEDASRFLQSVAESTGLLVLHGRENGHVGFMHHSFLEYYAAVGLQLDKGKWDVGRLCEELRWREVLLLYSGIVSDVGDSSIPVSAVLESADESDLITCEKLLFAVDCSLECDVPSQATQRMLLDAIERYASSGSLLCDDKMRDELGQRLGRLVQAAGHSEVEGRLSEWLKSGVREIKALALQLTGHVVTHSLASDSLAGEFLENISSVDLNDQEVIAACSSAARAPLLRCDKMFQKMQEWIGGGSVYVKTAVVSACNEDPSLATGLWEELLRVMDQNKAGLASSAATAILKTCSSIDLTAADIERIRPLRRSVEVLEKTNYTRSAKDVNVRYSKESLGDLLSSDDNERSLLALRLMPWVSGADELIYQSAMERVGFHLDREVVCSAVAALSLSDGARSLFRPSDYAIFKSILQDDRRTIDVKLSILRLLGKCSASQRVVTILTDFINGGPDRRVLRTALRSLVNSGSGADSVTSLLISGAKQALRGRHGNSQQSRRVVVDWLTAVTEHAAVVDEELARLMKSTIESRTAHDEIRKSALWAYAGAAQTSVEKCEFVTANLRRPISAIQSEMDYVPSRFVRALRRDIESIPKVYSGVHEVQDASMDRYRQILPVFGNGKMLSRLYSLRVAICEMRDVIAAYDEFSGELNMAVAAD